MNVDQTIDLEIEYEGETLDIREIPVTGTVDISQGYGYMGEGGSVETDLYVEFTRADVMEALQLHFQEKNQLPPSWATRPSVLGDLLDQIRDKAEEHFRCG